MDSELVNKLIISYIGIVGVYLRNPKFKKLQIDMKKYRNTMKHVNPDSVDVFKYINEAHTKGIISVKQAKMMYDYLLLFREVNIDENKLRDGLIEVIEVVFYKLRRHLSASIIMLVNTMDRDNIEDKLNVLYSFTKRKKIDIEFSKYFKMSRGN